MIDSPQHGTVQALMQEMRLDAANIERRKEMVGLDPDDAGRIASIKEVVQQHLEELTNTFFDRLTALEEARPLLANRALVEHARQLKRQHLAAMVQGEYGRGYVEQRLELALLYAKAGLDTRVFLGAFQHLLKSIGIAVVRRSQREPLTSFEAFMSLKKVAFFDIGLVLDTLVFERERVIRQ